MQNLRVNNSVIRMIKNEALSRYYFYMNQNIQGDFQIYIRVPLIKRKNIVTITMMTLITMEQETQKVYLMTLMLMTIANQYQSKLLLKKTKKTQAVIRLVIYYMKAEGIKDKIFIAENYVERIEPYLRDLINDHKIRDLENGKFI